MLRKPGYSIHVIHRDGTPVPVGFRVRQNKAIDLAEEKCGETGLEVRVWDTHRARCIYTAPAHEVPPCA